MARYAAWRGFLCAFCKRSHICWVHKIQLALFVEQRLGILSHQRHCCPPSGDVPVEVGLGCG